MLHGMQHANQWMRTERRNHRDQRVFYFFIFDILSAKPKDRRTISFALLSIANIDEFS
jgi:hypothetical protein